MDWVIAYLVSMFVVPGAYALIFLDMRGDNEIKLRYTTDLFELMGVVLFWPISLTYLTYNYLHKKHKEAVAEKAGGIIARYIHNDRNDRTALVNITESDLKLVLKAHRKKYLTLSNNQTELVRDELLNRNMERNLLK
jgi:hypothetical protein